VQHWKKSDKWYSFKIAIKEKKKSLHLMLGMVSHRWSKLSAYLEGFLYHTVTIAGPFLLKEDEITLSPHHAKLWHHFSPFNKSSFC